MPELQYTRPALLATAKRWMTPPVEALLVGEVRNERNGGVSPATLTSTIDSLLQGLEVFGLTEPDYVSLLGIVGIVGTDTEVRELL